MEWFSELLRSSRSSLGTGSSLEAFGDFRDVWGVTSEALRASTPPLANHPQKNGLFFPKN